MMESETSPYVSAAIFKGVPDDSCELGYVTKASRLSSNFSGYDAEMIGRSTSVVNVEPEAVGESVSDLADDINFARRDWNAE